ncbi:MAG: YggT family protein [Dehalococcoidia bacterium]|nr:YggT family protein [Dehalococcoidia bacterium]
MVWLFVGIIEVLIGMRVLLKLIGANPDNDFGGFVYNSAGVFLAPFFGLTGSPSSGGVVLEVPSLIAMLVYALVGWAIVRVILPLFDKPATRGTSTYDRSRK